MDFYTLFKFLHVLTAIAWVGGGFTLIVGSILAERAEGETALFKILDIMNVLGKSWFVPTSFLTVVFGAIAATFGNLWSEFWVLLGLAGFASTFFTGLLIIEPTGRKLGTLVAEGRGDEAIAQGRKLMTIARFDYTVMFVVVLDMVFKPGWTDFVVIAVMALILAAGAVAFLGLGQRQEAAA
ncbi:DUF2269 family protein [bacterium]|nr:MAG: DUF2269 family protein [bacterium]